MSNIKSTRSYRDNEGEYKRRDVQSSEYRRKKTEEKENWEDSEYILSDLVGNTTVCIHCMSNKCKKYSEPDHPNVFFPKKFTDYINCATKIPDLSNLLRNNPIKDKDFSNYQVFYTVCMYNLCKGKCKAFSQGCFGKIDLPNNGELIYCHPDLNRVQNNRIFIGLHIDIKMTKNNEDIETISIPYHLNNTRQNDDRSVNSQNVEHSHDSYRNRREKVEETDNLSVQPSAQLYSSKVRKNTDNIIVVKETNNDISTQNAKKDENLNIDMESIVNEIEKDSNTPKTEDLFDSNINQNDNHESSNKNDYYNYEKFVNTSYDFFDYMYNENIKLKNKISDLEDKLEKVLNLNNKILTQMENKKEEFIQKYKEMLKECNNSVTEQIHKTEFEKYFSFI